MKKLKELMLTIVFIYLITIGAYLHGSMIEHESIPAAWLMGFVINVLMVMLTLLCYLLAKAVLNELEDIKDL